MINKALYAFCGKTKKYILSAVAFDLLKLINGIAFAYIFAIVITGIIEKKPVSPSQILLFIVLIIIVVSIRTLATKMSTKHSFKIVREVKQNIRGAIYKKVTQMGISYLDTFTTQEITHLGVEGVEQLENYYGGYLTQFYYCFLSSIFLFIAVAPLDITVALILVFASLAIPLILQIIMNLVRKVQRKYWKKYSDVGNLFLDSLTGITTLKIFEADETVAKDMAEKAESFRKQTMRVLAMQLNSIVMIDWIAYGATAIAIIVAIVKYTKGNLSVFAVVAIILLAAEFFIPMKMLTSKFHVAMTGVAAGEMILDFLQKDVYTTSGDMNYEKGSDIKVENFSFSYKDGKEALKNISLEFKSKQFNALIGPSGCGKTTLASLICGQLMSTDDIYYGSVEKRGLKKGSLEENIVRISHDPHIFNATVRENVLMGKEGISDEKIIETLKSLKLWEFLEKEDGLDTMLLSGAKNISGGQAQRISIARALVSDFDVYIFDEATSNVDADSEEIILEIIKEISTLKTVIYISHKMSVVTNADNVYVLKSGELVEQGNHTTLIGENGVYAELYNKQKELLDFSNSAKVLNKEVAYENK